MNLPSGQSARLSSAGATSNTALLLLGLVHVVLLGVDDPQHLLLAGLLQVATNEQLVQNVVGFVEVEDDVQLADLGSSYSGESRVQLVEGGDPRTLPK
jgi:hypothetical protein